MTPDERRNTRLLTKRGASRKRRIAAGSGTSVQEVNRLIKQFDQAKQVMKQMGRQAGIGGGGKPRNVRDARKQAAALKQLQQSGGLPAELGGPGGGSPMPGGVGGFKGLMKQPPGDD